MKLDLNATLTFVAAKNSRRESACGHAVWNHYKQGSTLSQIIAAITAVGIVKARDHVRWDLDHGAIRVNDPALADEPDVAAAIIGGSTVPREIIAAAAVETARQGRGRRQAA